MKLQEMPKGILFGHVLIRPDVKEELEKTEGGIILTASPTEKPYTGEVVMNSDDTLSKAGDRVLYNKHAGQELSVAGVDYLLMQEKGAVHAIL